MLFDMRLMLLDGVLFWIKLVGSVMIFRSEWPDWVNYRRPCRSGVVGLAFC